MKKSDVVKIIVLAIVVTFLFQLFFGRTIAAKLSTVPWINRWGILDPQTPIIINTEREVRISDTGDVKDAANKAKQQVSLVYKIENGGIHITGTALHLTSDGIFIAAKTVFADPKATYYIKLPAGNTVKILEIIPDPATNIAVAKASIKDVGVVTLGASDGLEVGDKVVFVAASNLDFVPRVVSTYVSFAERDVLGASFNADLPSRSFGVQPVSGLEIGQGLFNTEGELVGIWDGARIISSSVVRGVVDNYFIDRSTFKRPQFGILYRNITKLESGSLSVPQGALITGFVANSKALPAQAGLKEGDIILEVDRVVLSQDRMLEEVLQKYKANDSLTFVVQRGVDKVNIPFKVVGW